MKIFQQKNPSFSKNSRYFPYFSQWNKKKIYIYAHKKVHLSQISKMYHMTMFCLMFFAKQKIGLAISSAFFFKSAAIFFRSPQELIIAELKVYSPFCYTT